MRILYLIGVYLVLSCTHVEALSYQFEVFGLAGEGQMSANDINNRNEIVGSVDSFSNGSLRTVGFLRTASGISLIDVPEAGPLNGTRAHGINDLGQIVGTYVTETPGAAQAHGFLYENGEITRFDAPNSTDTTALAINNAGVIAGRAFISDYPNSGTAYTLADDQYEFFRPDGVNGSFGIAIDGINDQGNAVGRVLDETGFRAFAIIDGVYMPFTINSNADTTATGINNLNQVVGYYRESFRNYGFLMDATGIYQIDVPEADTFGTYISGVNDSGFLVGAIDTPGFPSTQALFASPCDVIAADCIEAARIGDAVIDFGTPVPLPAAIWFLLSGLVMLARPFRPSL